MRFPFLILVGSSLVACGGGAPQPATPSDTEPAATEPAATPESTGGQPQASGESEPAAVPSLEPTVGTRELESRKIEMNFDLTLFKGESAAGMQSGNWSVYEERTIEVKKVAGRAIDQALVIYGRREAKPLMGVEQPSVTAGKSYLIGSGGSVESAAGKKLSKAEKSAVSTEYDWVGQPSPLAELLAGMKPGASAEADAGARRMLVGELPALNHDETRVTVTLNGIEKGEHTLASLKVQLAAEISAADMKFALELEGPAVVDVATGWVTSLSLTGKVKANGKVKHKKGKLDARGKGTAEITRKAKLS